MKDSSKRWIEAGVILAENPEAYVPCPVCAEGRLEVEDAPHPGAPERLDRYLRCVSCGAQEVLVRLKAD
jgi:hypothetical protein